MLDILKISKSEYIDILRKRGVIVSPSISTDKLYRKVKYLNKKDLIYLLSIRGIVLKETGLESILNVLFKDIHKKKQSNVSDELYRYHHNRKFKHLKSDLHKYHYKQKLKHLIPDLHRYHHKQKLKHLKNEINRNIQKRKNTQIINELKKLKRLKRSNLVKKENISQKELDEAKRLSNLPTKIFKKLVQLRNVETTGLKRSDLLYILMRTQKHHKEDEYLGYLLDDSQNEVMLKSNKIKMLIIKLGMQLDKSDRDAIRKRLEEISKLKLTKRQTKKILEELTELFNDLQFKRKHINNAFDESSYYGLKDLEYTFGDLDDYYIPILAKESFDGNYQMYTCRGDKERTMNITDYINTIRPYLITLIDEKKICTKNTTRHIG